MSFVPRLALALALGAAAAAVPAASAAGGNLKPPVIHEVFTRLPCPAKQISTMDIEACQEQQILASDAKIDALARAIFPRLFDDRARLRFLAGEKAWLSYRAVFCQSQSDVYEGGTEAGVLDASCAEAVNAQHVKDLAAFVKALRR